MHRPPHASESEHSPSNGERPSTHDAPRPAGPPNRHRRHPAAAIHIRTYPSSLLPPHACLFLPYITGLTAKAVRDTETNFSWPTRPIASLHDHAAIASQQVHISIYTDTTYFTDFVIMQLPRDRSRSCWIRIPRQLRMPMQAKAGFPSRSRVAIASIQSSSNGKRWMGEGGED